MIRKASKMITEIKEQMRGGSGSVEITHIFQQNELKGKARLCAKISIKPGCSIGLHPHVEEEEIFYIIKGNATVHDDGLKQEVIQGDAILTGGGASHAIENSGDEVLELLAV